jgi:sialidase-1
VRTCLITPALASVIGLVTPTSEVVFPGTEEAGPDAPSALYRIPAVLPAAGGPLLAFAELRPALADNGTNDLVVSSSLDAGATWSAPRVIADVPGRSLNNPCGVHVSRGLHAGRTLVMFQSYPTGCGEACVQPGVTGDKICQTLVIHSDDQGATWSAPRDITAGTKRPTVATSVASGPGVGIQLTVGTHAGRILVPFNEGPYGTWRVYAAWSDDGGDTWSFGAPAPDGSPGRGNEVQAVERPDGSILMVSRQFGGGARRKSTVSRDGGATWSPLMTVPDLVDPSCMGGLAARTVGGRQTIVCSGPGSPTARVDGTLWASFDGGVTWPASVRIADGPFAYSVPVFLDDHRVGVLYEIDRTGTIAFAAVDVPKPPATAPSAPPAPTAPTATTPSAPTPPPDR